MGIGLGVEVDQLDASRSSLVWSREVVLGCPTRGPGLGQLSLMEGECVGKSSWVSNRGPGLDQLSLMEGE